VERRAGSESIRRRLCTARPHRTAVVDFLRSACRAARGARAAGVNKDAKRYRATMPSSQRLGSAGDDDDGERSPRLSTGDPSDRPFVTPLRPTGN